MLRMFTTTAREIDIEWLRYRTLRIVSPLIIWIVRGMRPCPYHKDDIEEADKDSSNKTDAEGLVKGRLRGP